MPVFWGGNAHVKHLVGGLAENSLCRRAALLAHQLRSVYAVAPISTDMGAPCVLPRKRASHARRRAVSRHTLLAAIGGSETVELADPDAERTPGRSQQPRTLLQVAIGAFGVSHRGFEVAAVVPGHFQP